MFKKFNFFGKPKDNQNEDLKLQTLETDSKSLIPQLTESEISECILYEAKIRTKEINENEIDNFYGEKDSMFLEAAEIVVIAQQGSASLLQRKLKLGYNRAGRLIDQLEYYGIVGPFEGSNARIVNIKSINELNDFNVNGEILSRNQKHFRENLIHLYQTEISEKVNNYFEESEKERNQLEIDQIRNEILEKEKIKKEKERLKTLRRQIEIDLQNAGMISDFEKFKREPISQDVQDKVWNRDFGKCVKCGNSEKLEFDHIIPFSKGGSNTYRNIQLLCEKCNREKSNKIG